MADSGFKTVAERAQDALREIGTLLLAFAPLDVGLSDNSRSHTSLLLFFVWLGTCLFISSRLLERYRETRAASQVILHLLGVGVMSAMTYALLSWRT